MIALLLPTRDSSLNRTNNCGGLYEQASVEVRIYLCLHDHHNTCLLCWRIFFGAYYMKSKIEAQQAAVLEQQKLEAERERQLREQKLYSEQDFIRFYYAVYAPVQELKRAHFEKMAAWPNLDKSAQKDALEQLVEAAKQTGKQLDKEVPLPTSPLLVQAHSQFNTGVRAYLDGMKQLLSDQNSNALSPAAISSRLSLDGWFKEASSSTIHWPFGSRRTLQSRRSQKTSQPM